MSDGASSGGMTNEDVLEQFRKQWQQELQIDKQRQPSHSAQPHQPSTSGSASATYTPLATSTPSDSPGPSSPQSRKAELLSRPPPVVAVAASSPAAGSKGKASTSASTEQSSSREAAKDATAIELYSAAVQAEREGRLNDALRGYRSAFRKDEHVDRAYHRVQSALAQRKEKSKDNTEATGQDDQIDDLVFTYQRTLQLGPDYEREKQVKGRMFTANYVERLMQSFRENPYVSEEEKYKRQQEEKKDPTETGKGDSKATPPKPSADAPDDTLAFKPLKAFKPVPIAKLPDEILLQIASHLCALSPNAHYPDISSLERGLGLVCRKLRILTLQSQSLWRDICEAVYKPPLMLDASKLSATTLLDSTHSHRNAACIALAQAKYFNDWRLMWIEQPRIRTDGVYISQITYLRRGAADASFYDPTHVVTYYRYLVFLPSGDVVSLLSHDIPKEVVPNLLSSTHGSNARMHKAGYTVGKWRLIHLPSPGTKDGEKDTSATIVQCTSLEDPRITNVADVKYSFKLICRLKSTTRGKMNKLEMLQLLTINHQNGTEDQISVKQVNGSMPSFYFSRVLSYD
ncbi:hypothetical protein P389DRAFT_34749 [Cystobasidium minutum MCA 4210]|uniref:uncharacterized protein n=1 Tax=Cystobasidium minutum MCA 4210 TaxID=1397322 RepID=UPI0034CD203C|eukprot:jgi/Rhomi1/34749/CE34748_1504